MRDKNTPKNPAESNFRERLAQSRAAVLKQVHKHTGKRKYTVYKPAKTDNAEGFIFAISPKFGYTVKSRIVGNTPQLVFDIESYSLTETRYLSEKEATLLRLKGYSVDECDA